MSEILKSQTRKQKKANAFLLMFSYVPFCHAILSTNVTVSTKSMWLAMWKIHCQACGIVFQSKVKITKHLQKQY